MGLGSFPFSDQWEHFCIQERPPAWTQEAYRPPCSKYSLCCPNWVPPPGQGTPPARVPPLARVPPPAGYAPCQGTPPAEYPPWQGTPPAGYPPWQGTPQGTPPGQGTPLAGYPPQAGPGRVPPPYWLPHGILGNVAKHYGIRVPPCGQTDRHVSKHYLPSYYVRGR